MSTGSAEISPRLVQPGHFVRTSPTSEWSRVFDAKVGQISVGRKTTGPDGVEAIGRAQTEPSAVLAVGGGAEINQPFSEPIEVKTEQVHAREIGRPDVIQVPGTHVWVKVTQILDGQSGENPTSATRFFTCIDEYGNQQQFDSYFEIEGAGQSRLKNERIVRVVRE